MVGGCAAVAHHPAARVVIAVRIDRRHASIRRHFRASVPDVGTDPVSSGRGDRAIVRNVGRIVGHPRIGRRIGG
jgi:hypothetical protein